jgi:ADP-ribosyl-[dinitrogen reductase] hydrolase
MKQEARFRGALLGLAAGDALGTTLEFRCPGSFSKIEDMVGGGPFRLSAGEWTDDTSMALCLAESLTEKRGFDPIDQLERYTRWARHGHLSSNGRVFDVGGTVRDALGRFWTTRQPYCGSSDPETAGNGSLMRLAPVPLFYARSHHEAIDRSGESSRTTHGARTAIDACRYMGALIVGAVNGASKEELLTSHYSPVEGYWQQCPLVDEIDEIAAGSYKHKDPPEIEGTGYVVKSLEAALWAFCQSDSFRNGCLLAVNLGDDADTTGAVFGQLAGAYYGEDSIPQSWRDKLAKKRLIESFADQLFALSAQGGGNQFFTASCPEC